MKTIIIKTNKIINITGANGINDVKICSIHNVNYETICYKIKNIQITALRLEQNGINTYILSNISKVSENYNNVIQNVNQLGKIIMSPVQTVSNKIKVTGTALKLENLATQHIYEEQQKIGDHRYGLKYLGLNIVKERTRWKINSLLQNCVTDNQFPIWSWQNSIQEGIQLPQRTIQQTQLIADNEQNQYERLNTHKKQQTTKELQIGNYIQTIQNHTKENLHKALQKSNFITFKSGLNEIALCVISNDIKVSIYPSYQEIISNDTNKELMDLVTVDLINIKPREIYQGKGIGLLKTPIILKPKKKK